MSALPREEGFPIENMSRALWVQENKLIKEMFSSQELLYLCRKGAAFYENKSR